MVETKLMGMHVLLCLVTLTLGACSALPQQPVTTYAEQPPVPQTIDLELPSAPVAPKERTRDIMVQAEPRVTPVAVIEPVSHCQIGFDHIMAEASKKIDAQRHM